MNLKLEVVIVPVSDVDRAKAFYAKLGFREDIDFVAGSGRRVVQLTPPGSGASIHIGKGITSAAPGSLQKVYLIVSDIEKTRADLMSRGVDVSEVFHFDGLLGPQVTDEIQNVERTRCSPRSRIRTATVGCYRKSRYASLVANGRRSEHAMDIAALAELLHETEQHHGDYEKTHAKHNW